MSALYDDLRLTRAEVREVDRRAIEEYGIPGVVLMENAGINATRIILAEFAPSEQNLKRIVIVCGRGNNGGDGFVIARHLTIAGSQMQILLACEPHALTGDAAINHEIAKKMRLPMLPFFEPDDIEAHRHILKEATLVIDAVLGTGFHGEVQPPLDGVIVEINAARNAKVVAVDVPSGLDCDTGRGTAATVRADHTITFVAKKVGFDSPNAASFLGRVHIAQIGAPTEIITAVLNS